VVAVALRAAAVAAALAVAVRGALPSASGTVLAGVNGWARNRSSKKSLSGSKPAFGPVMR
jgi:hypothetical protein